MNVRIMKYICGSVLLLFMLTLPLLTPVQQYLSIPTEMKVTTANSVSTPVWNDDSKALTAFSSTDDDEVFHEFAGIPLKKTSVQGMKDIRLVPGDSR